LYRQLKEGKASIPKPSAWMRTSLKTKLNGFVLWLIAAQLIGAAAHLLGPSRGLSSAAVELTLQLLGASGVIAGVWLLVVQNQVMTIINRIIGRLDNIAQGDLT